MIQRIRLWFRWPVAILAIASSVAFLVLLLNYAPISQHGLFLPKTLEVQIPGCRLMLGADRTGIECAALLIDHETHWGIRSIDVHLGYSDYRWGESLHGLGFAVAIQTEHFNDDDVRVFPYAALRVPYWFLIGGSILVFLYASGSLAHVRTMSRFGVRAKFVTALVLAGFLIANIIPSASRPGATIQPHGIGDWCRLVLIPSSYREIDLCYGFPSVSYRRGIVNHQTVSIFYGNDQLGWRAEQFIENLLIAVAFAMIVGWMVDRSSRSIQRTSDLPETRGPGDSV